MTGRTVWVLDSSVGVKWFREESGAQEAYGFLAAAGEGSAVVAAPTHFVHEVLSVVRRDFAIGDVLQAWRTIVDSGLDIVPLGDEVVAEAALQCERLGCCFYDALAPAVASLLGATLVSADTRAHAAYPGVVLIG